MVQLARAAVDTCLQVLRSVSTVITCGVPNTPGGSMPSGTLQPGPRQASPGQHNQREPTGDGEVQTPPRSVRESRPAVDSRLSAKTMRHFQVTLPSSSPHLSVLPRASSCGPAQ